MFGDFEHSYFRIFFKGAARIFSNCIIKQDIQCCNKERKNGKRLEPLVIFLYLFVITNLISAHVKLGLQRRDKLITGEDEEKGRRHVNNVSRTIGRSFYRLFIVLLLLTLALSTRYMSHNTTR